MTSLDKNDDGTLDGAGEAEYESVNTEETTTGILAHDTTETRFPTQPEYSAPFFVNPHPAVDNPVLSGSDVTDETADGVADPFFYQKNGVVYIFHEVLPSTGEFKIAYSTLNQDLTVDYGAIVLEDVGHAYPFVFNYNGVDYMMPNQQFGTSADEEVRLYEADSFPTDWTLVETLFTEPNNRPSDPTPVHLPDREGEPWDSSPLEWDGTWYIFVLDSDDEYKRLYYSNSLRDGSWSEHPSSPLYTSDSDLIRQAGRPQTAVNYIDMPCRNTGSNEPLSGSTEVNMLRITELSQTSFAADPYPHNPVVTRSYGLDEWNSDRMHHLDMLRPELGYGHLALVDGNDGNWNLGLQTISDEPVYQAYGTVSSDQTINADSFTNTVPISMPETGRQTGYLFDAGNNEIVAPVSGIYHVDWKASVDNINATPPFVFMTNLKINGTYQDHTNNRFEFDSTTGETVGSPERVTLTKGDRLQFSVTNKGDGSVDVVRPGSSWSVDFVSGL